MRRSSAPLARPGQPEIMTGHVAAGDASATRKALVVVPHQSYIVGVDVALASSIAADDPGWDIKLSRTDDTELATGSLAAGLAAETRLALDLETDVDLSEAEVLTFEVIPGAGDAPDLPDCYFTIAVTSR